MASSPRSPIPASRESVSLALFMQATGIFLLYLLGTTRSRLQSWVFEKPRFEVVLEDLFQQREERKMSLDVISGKHHPRGFHTYFFHDVVEEIHVVRRWRIYGEWNTKIWQVDINRCVIFHYSIVIVEVECI